MRLIELLEAGILKPGDIVHASLKTIGTVTEDGSLLIKGEIELPATITLPTLSALLADHSPHAELTGA